MAKVTEKICPCKDCNYKGCGSYHDNCKDFQEWKDSFHPERKEAVEIYIHTKNAVTKKIARERKRD